MLFEWLPQWETHQKGISYTSDFSVGIEDMVTGIVEWLLVASVVD